MCNKFPANHLLCWFASATFVPDYGISAAISAHLTQTRRKKSYPA
jgi:hypothetical protein